MFDGWISEDFLEEVIYLQKTVCGGRDEGV